MRDERYDSDETRIAKTRIASSQLLAPLKEHHDYTVPFQFVPKVIKIKVIEPEEAEPIEIGILPIDEPVLSVDAIKRVVCRQFGISHTEMVSPRRDKKVQRPRMIAMYLAKELTDCSFPALGRFFQRDHSSVIHSVRKMEGIVTGDDQMARDTQYLLKVLTA